MLSLDFGNTVKHSQAHTMAYCCFPNSQEKMSTSVLSNKTHNKIFFFKIFLNMQGFLYENLEVCGDILNETMQSCMCNTEK